MVTETDLQAAIDGNTEIQDSIINELMPEVLNICRGLSRGNGRYFNELESLGLYTLVTSVRGCKALHPTFDLYVYKTVRGRLLDFLRSEQRRKKISGSAKMLPTVMGQIVKPTTISEELDDLLLSNHDREIIIMRLEGYTMQEIADHVGCAKVTIHRIVERVKHEYQQRNRTKA